jgi:glucokinase
MSRNTRVVSEQPGKSFRLVGKPLMNTHLSPTAQPINSSETPLYADGHRLLTDIGGTNARFALERRAGVISDVRVYPCASFAGVHEVIKQYLTDVGGAAVQHAAIAIANPVDGDTVQMTNWHWSFSIEELRLALSLSRLTVINDFTALAMALPKIRGTDCQKFGSGEPLENEQMGL